MKKVLLLTKLLLPALVLLAQEGIQFESGNWEEALQTARAEDKLIFVDAYTTWCGPCKMMTRDVFPEKAVGDFYNDNFVNVKMDMEAGEGIALARKYRVKAYPSLLFIDGEGQLVHRAVGYHNAPKFLELGKVALDPSRRLSSYQSRYEAGERDPEFLHDFAMASYEAMDGSQQVIAEQYLRTQRDWSTIKNMRFIFTFVEDIDSPMFEYLADHRQEFEQMFGSQAVISRVQNLIMKEAFADDEGEKALQKVESLFNRVYPEVADHLTSLFRMNYFQYTGDTEAYAQATLQYFENFPPEDPAEWNNAAWNFFEMVEDKDMLKEAVEWAEKSVDMDGQYYNYDTLASLYYKLGKRRKARKAAEQAIQLAKENGEDYSATQALLEKIEEM